MERKEEFVRFCSILAICANYTTAYAGDILYDTPKMWEQYCDQDRDWPILFVRKTGADNIERYRDALIAYKEPSDLPDCIEECKRTLGLDFYVEITPHLIIVKNFTLEPYELRQLQIRFEGWGEVVIAD